MDTPPPPVYPEGNCPWHPDQPDSKKCEGCLSVYEQQQEDLMDDMRQEGRA